MKGVLVEGAGQNLFVEVNRDKLPLGITVFLVSRHPFPLNGLSCFFNTDDAICFFEIFL